MPLSEELKRQARLFIIKWDSENPTDNQWRRHFSIPFGSAEHLNVDVIDQQIWAEELQLLAALSANPNGNIDENGRVIVLEEKGEHGMSQKDIDDSFDNISIKELNEKHGR